MMWLLYFVTPGLRWEQATDRSVYMIPETFHKHFTQRVLSLCYRLSTCVLPTRCSNPPHGEEVMRVQPPCIGSVPWWQRPLRAPRPLPTWGHSKCRLPTSKLSAEVGSVSRPDARSHIYSLNLSRAEPPHFQSPSLVCNMLSHSVLSNSATPWTKVPQAPLSMGFFRQNTEVGCHLLLQGIFLTQGSNPHPLHCWWVFHRQASRKALVYRVSISVKNRMS